MKNMNEKRADWAHVAVVSFAEETGLNVRRERELVVKDLLCDLRHYCDRHGLNYTNLYDLAYDSYRAEIVEEGPKAKLRSKA